MKSYTRTQRARRRQATYKLAKWEAKSLAECIIIAVGTVTMVSMVTLTIAVLMGY